MKCFVTKHAFRARHPAIFEVDGRRLTNGHLVVDRHHVVDGIPVRIGTDHYKTNEWAQTYDDALARVESERLRRIKAWHRSIVRVLDLNAPLILVENQS